MVRILKKIYGVEKGDVAELAKESVKLNKLEEKIQILNMDLKDLRIDFPRLVLIQSYQTLPI